MRILLHLVLISFLPPCILALAQNNRHLEDENEDFSEDLRPAAGPAKFESYYEDQCLDHDNCDYGSERWRQRYWAQDTYYNASNPVIFFMLGGELDISTWVVNGVWQQYASTYGAYMLTVEHRFFGESWPIRQKDSVANSTLKATMKVDQALRDFARLLKWFQREQGLQNAPVFVLGGSYPGALSAWFRQKYPNLTKGALASSAPLHYKLTFPEYIKTISKVVRENDKDCFDKLKEVFWCMEKIANEEVCMSAPDVQRADLPGIMGRCNSEPNDFTDEIQKQQFFQRVGRGVWQSANPWTENESKCKILKDNWIAGNPIGSYVKFLEKTKNTCSSNGNQSSETQLQDNSSPKYPGSVTSWHWLLCTAFSNMQVADTDLRMLGTGFGIAGDFYACPAYYGDRNWSLDDLQEAVDNTNNLYGGTDNYTGTCVIFVNGGYDPWHSLGITSNSSQLSANNNVVYFIPQGEHMDDMFYPDTLPINALDVTDVTATQQLIQQKIGSILSNSYC